MKKPSLASILQEEQPTPKDGDSDTSDTGVESVVIEKAVNGYAMTYNYDDDTMPEKYVYQTIDEVITQLRKCH